LIAHNQFQRLRGLLLKKTIDGIEKNFYELTSEQKKSFGTARENIRFLLPYDLCIAPKNGRTIAQIAVLIYYLQYSGDLINKANPGLNLAQYK
jgi:hypothetical protein